MDHDPREPSFTLQDFRKWMEANAPDSFNLSKPRLIGMEVEPKVTLKRIIRRLEPEEGDVEAMAREFKDNGGVIRDVDGPFVMVEVSCGTFIVSKNCVKRKD